MAELQPAHLIASALGVAAAFTDLRWRRVPNWLTVPAALLGLTLAAVTSGPRGLGLAALGMGLGLAIGVAGMLLAGCFGGGDTKLLGAFGALGGTAFLISTLVYGAIVGGLMAVGIALSHRRLKQAINGLVTFMAACASRCRPISLEAVSTGVTIPFAVALGAGAVAAAMLPPPWALVAGQ
ncbi:MAG: prepilin peptidase [Armatimonadetes bacterium]|nr:prepilin peptidase [Armatimonadota bacterium]